MTANLAVSAIGECKITEQGFVIQLRPEYRAGLQGLSDFSHAIALWWANLVDNPAQRQCLVIERPYTATPNDVGVFATRSEARPNPIGLSVFLINAVDLDNGLISAPYFDMIPGPPILDVKPYIPASDRVARPGVPAHFSHWPSNLEASAAHDWSKEFRT